MTQEDWLIYHGQLIILGSLLSELDLVNAGATFCIVGALGIFAGLMGERENK
jgi:hypothetical protein